MLPRPARTLSRAETERERTAAARSRYTVATVYDVSSEMWLLLRNNRKPSRGKRQRMSRPSLPPVQRRTRTMGVRLRDDEWQALVSRAAAAGQRPTAYVRDLALTSSRPSRAAAEVASAEERRELRRIGANLNQVARQLHGWRGQAHVAALVPVIEDLQRWIVRRDDRGR